MLDLKNSYELERVDLPKSIVNASRNGSGHERAILRI